MRVAKRIGRLTMMAVLAAGIFVVAPAGAIAANEMHWFIAGGVGARPDYEGSNDYRALPIGTVRLNWDSGQYFALKGTESSGAAVRTEGNLLGSDMFQLGPVLQYRLERNDVQSGRVDAMSTVDGAWEAGGFVGLKMDDWRFRTTVTGDISSTYDGTLIELLVGYERTYDSNLGVEWHVASTWASDGYMGTYFGVDAADAAASGFSTYDADAGFKDIGTRLSLSWAGEDWGGWRIIGIVSYFRMLGDAEDSPVVDDAGDANQFFGGFGVGYER